MFLNDKKNKKIQDLDLDFSVMMIIHCKQYPIKSGTSDSGLKRINLLYKLAISNVKFCNKNKLKL